MLKIDNIAYRKQYISKKMSSDIGLQLTDPNLSASHPSESFVD